MKVAARMKPVKLKHALISATTTFLLLFALGFVFGAIRVVYLTPRLGPLAATSVEAPAMVIAAWFLTRWSVRHWRVSHLGRVRWTMVLWFLALLASFETLLGAALFGRTATELWGALATPAGLVGLLAQLIAALLPVFVSRRGQSCG